MPCRSDYMEASVFERESQIVANLIVYLDMALDKTPPKWVVECANNYYGAVLGDQGGDPRLVPLLCDMVNKLTKEERDKHVYNARDPMSRRLADWVEAHDRADRKRQAIKAKQLHQEEVAQNAKAKLTKEELDTLLLLYGR